MIFKFVNSYMFICTDARAHWKATMEYRKTKDIIHVIQVLGHRSIKNTLQFNQLINPTEDDYVSEVAKTVNEARELVESDFEYIFDIDDVKIARARITGTSVYI